MSKLSMSTTLTSSIQDLVKPTPQQWANFTGLTWQHQQATKNKEKKFAISTDHPARKNNLDCYVMAMGYDSIPADILDCSNVDWDKQETFHPQGKDCNVTFSDIETSKGKYKRVWHLA